MAQIVAPINDFRCRVAREDTLYTNEELDPRECRRTQVQDSDSQYELVEVARFESCAEQQEGQKENTSSKSDEPNQRVLKRKKQQQDGPGHEDDHPCLELPKPQTFT